MEALWSFYRAFSRGFFVVWLFILEGFSVVLDWGVCGAEHCRVWGLRFSMGGRGWSVGSPADYIFFCDAVFLILTIMSCRRLGPERAFLFWGVGFFTIKKHRAVLLPWAPFRGSYLVHDHLNPKP